ncbi:MAG: hypothetical protein ACRDOH_01520 [Streptosporangiaceae bacterium]
MTGGQWHAVGLGPVRVLVDTGHDGVTGYLRDFYSVEPADGPDGREGWVIEARVAAPEPGMAVLEPWQVGYRADAATRRARICAEDPRNLGITVRKAVREALLEYCEARGYVMLHASAVAREGRVVIVAGDKGSGKTTLALSAALTCGYQYLSNDHLILYQDGGHLMATSLPTPIPVKAGTYLDYEALLPQPWENEDTDIEALRALPRPQRYAAEGRLLYTYRSLGHPSPVHVPLDGRRVTVVLAGYAPDGHPASALTPVAGPVAALSPHVRFDWAFDPALNTRYLPRAERDRDAYARDAADRLAELAARSAVVAWRHHGDIAPLLNALDRQEG